MMLDSLKGKEVTLFGARVDLGFAGRGTVRSILSLQPLRVTVKLDSGGIVTTLWEECKLISASSRLLRKAT